jgi:predicted Rossmann fold flavoprotein
MIRTDVLILGAGAAGLMCGIEAGRRGRAVVIVDHAQKPAEKIRISGGGRCNFTNLHCDPKRFLSQNPHFCVSALKRFTQHDFIARVTERGIAWHEKTLGQLFCDTSSRAIIDMLLEDLAAAGGDLRLGLQPGEIVREDSGYRVGSSHGVFWCQSLVIATGGKSIPKMGATGIAYEVARQFGLAVVEPRPGLVPFTLTPPALDPVAELAGVSVEARVACGETAFEEALLFTHRGLSGPAALQVSSFWREGEPLSIDLARGQDALGALQKLRRERPRLTLPAALDTLLPRRLAAQIAARTSGEARLADLSDTRLREVADAVHRWSIKPAGTEGWRTAEVTVGGIDTRHLSSRTLEANAVPGLYFIGECVDVTGWLGGYNFQWAWSSGWAAGQVV